MRQIWTIVRNDGPNNLGLCSIQLTVLCGRGRLVASCLLAGVNSCPVLAMAPGTGITNPRFDWCYNNVGDYAATSIDASSECDTCN